MFKFPTLAQKVTDEESKGGYLYMNEIEDDDYVVYEEIKFGWDTLPMSDFIIIGEIYN
jgi:hypothetical protein